MDQARVIDEIINNAIKVMDASKYDVFELCESTRQELEALQKEHDVIRKELEITIAEVDRLEREFRNARIRLTEVSRDFVRYTEKDIKAAYENATNIQLDLIVQNEKEMNLKARREDLQIRIRNLQKTIKRAELVISKMNVALEYLNGDLGKVSEILQSARNRQMMGLRIILAQEEERKRIAREIHDGFAQDLANIILRTEIVTRMVQNKQNDLLLEEMNDLKEQMRINLESVRKMIFNLRPMTLDDLGLIPTLRKFTQDFEEKYKIRTDFVLKGKEIRLSPPMEVAVYRFVQEAFSNVQKHSQASHAVLEVTFFANELKIVVSDNGKGFNLQTYDEKKAVAEEHYGLMGMRERVELLDGTFHLDSRENGGTRITMTVPITD